METGKKTTPPWSNGGTEKLEDYTLHLCRVDFLSLFFAIAL